MYVPCTSVCIIKRPHYTRSSKQNNIDVQKEQLVKEERERIQDCICNTCYNNH